MTEKIVQVRPSVRFFCSGATLPLETWYELAGAFGRVADVQCSPNGFVVVDFHRSTPEADCRRCVSELNNAIVDGHVLTADSGFKRVVVQPTQQQPSAGTMK
jgi:hypothetical protein